MQTVIHAFRDLQRYTSVADTAAQFAAFLIVVSIIAYTAWKAIFGDRNHDGDK